MAALPVLRAGRCSGRPDPPGSPCSWRSAEQTLAERFAAALELLAVPLPVRRRGGYTGWAAALQKWSAPTAGRGPGGCDARLCGKALAGAASPSPPTARGWSARTAANEEAPGRAGRKKTGPQLFPTTLWHMGLGLPWDYRIGPGRPANAAIWRTCSASCPTTPSMRCRLQRLRPVPPPPGARWSFLVAGRLQRPPAGAAGLRRAGGAGHGLPVAGVRDRPPVVLRVLIVLTRGKDKAYLVTDIRDEAVLPAAEAALLYEMRWGWKASWSASRRCNGGGCRPHAGAAAGGVGLGGPGPVAVRGMTTASAWPVRRPAGLVGGAQRGNGCGGRCGERPSAGAGGRRWRGSWRGAVRDGYARKGSKKARNWPHKKRERPPGAPDIRQATRQEVRSAQRFRQKQDAVA